jgi:HEPN domain-containing protein
MSGKGCQPGRGGFILRDVFKQSPGTTPGTTRPVQADPVSLPFLSFLLTPFLLEYDGPAATVCLLCQQMAEKYLKAFALLQDRPLKRIHDLEVLLRDCIALDGSLKDLGTDAKLLTSYYMPSRYPDDLPEDVRPEEGVSAYEAAVRIRVRILASVDRLLKPPGTNV